MQVQGVAPKTPLEPEVLQRLRHFSKMNRLKKEALKVVASNLCEHELAGLHEMFRAMDQDGNGTISVGGWSAADDCDVLNTHAEQLIKWQWHFRGMKSACDLGNGLPSC